MKLLEQEPLDQLPRQEAGGRRQDRQVKEVGRQVGGR